MTEAILKNVEHVEDLLMFSKAYKKRTIPVNISKLSRELNKDRKTIKKYLKGVTPKKTRTREK